MRLADFHDYLVERLGDPRPRGHDAALAREIGVAPVVLYQWKTRVRGIPEARLEAVAAALGLKVSIMVVDESGAPFTPPEALPQPH